MWFIDWTSTKANMLSFLIFHSSNAFLPKFHNFLFPPRDFELHTIFYVYTYSLYTCAHLSKLLNFYLFIYFCSTFVSWWSWLQIDGNIKSFNNRQMELKKHLSHDFLKKNEHHFTKDKHHSNLFKFVWWRLHLFQLFQLILLQVQRVCIVIK